MKQTATFILFMLALLMPTTLPAQNYEKILQNAYKQLENGKCEKASESYETWRDLTGERDTDLEARIKECGNKSDNSSSATNGNSHNGHEYVDLGLPSGLKWATCNVGAACPEQYGQYFAWGETSPKNTYTEANSLTYNKSVSQLRLSGILGNDGKLISSHDAARQNWGGSWRMPTLNEIKELIDNTTTSWTTHNGVQGCKVTSKKNGKSIFFPAAGCHSGDSLQCDGFLGYYWSSSPNERFTNVAYNLSVGSDYFVRGSSYHYYGLSVRPVSE